jgi:endo-1,4-beta-xylanase
MSRNSFYPSLDRRRFIGGAAVIGAALALTRPTLAQPTTGPGLAFEAARSGRVFGSAVRTDQVGRGGDLRAIALRDCSLFTPEIGLQWKAIEPSPGQLAFAKMDDLTELAAATGQKVVGHSLLWHLGAPAWVEGALSDQRSWAPIHRHFASVLPRFSDSIGVWNVVNEPIDIGPRPDGLRRNVFLEAFGPDYINRALEDARDLTPKTRLMINEFGLEYDFPVESARRTAFLKLVERLRAANAPLDVIGLQAHLDLGKGHVSQTEIRSFIHELSDMGLTLMVTELDVKESNYVAPAAVRDQLVADETRRYLDAVLDAPAVKGVATWGLSDRHSWLEVTAADYARFPGAWGRPGEGPGLNRGLPYDSDLRPKPMYDAIVRAFQGARPAQAA